MAETESFGPPPVRQESDWKIWLLLIVLIVASFLGMELGLSMANNAFYELVYHWTADGWIKLPVIAFGIGFLPGTLQWLLVRRHLGDSRTWILLVIANGLVGMTLLASEEVLWGFLTKVLIGYAVIAGTGLVALVRRHTGTVEGFMDGTGTAVASNDAHHANRSRYLVVPALMTLLLILSCLSVVLAETQEAGTFYAGTVAVIIIVLVLNVGHLAGSVVRKGRPKPSP